MRPSGSAKRSRVDLGHAHAASRAAAACGGARPAHWSRPCGADRASARTARRSARSAARRRSPAARSRRAAAARRARARRRTARRAARRRPRSRPRPAAKAWRSSVSVSPPSIAASNSPSGLSARRIWISAPGRSLTNCSASADTTRSSAPSRNGSASSSATTASGPLAQRTGRDRRCRPCRSPRAPRAPHRSACRDRPPVELPQHRAEPLGEILRDAVDQERPRARARARARCRARSSCRSKTIGLVRHRSRCSHARSPVRARL